MYIILNNQTMKTITTGGPELAMWHAKIEAYKSSYIPNSLREAIEVDYNNLVIRKK